MKTDEYTWNIISTMYRNEELNSSIKIITVPRKIRNMREVAQLDASRCWVIQKMSHEAQVYLKSIKTKN
jgi:hypothetical protein